MSKAYFRLLMFCMSFFLSFACDRKEPTEYEKASGIPIPSEAVAKEFHDDGKLVKTTWFKIDKEILASFVEKQQFIRFSSDHVPQFWGVYYLKEKPDFTHLDHFYYKSGESGNILWLYIADLHSGSLWAEIKYPGKPAY